MIVSVDLRIRTEALEQIRQGYGELKDRALHWLYQDQGFEGPSSILYSADLRYRGQSYEIDTPLEESWIESGDLEAIARAFHLEHERHYEHADDEAPVQVINLRLIVVAVPPKPEFTRQDRSDETPRAHSQADVFFDGRRHKADVYQRGDLRAGHRFDGPAIVQQDDCTTCILDGIAAEVDDYGNLILEQRAAT